MANRSAREADYRACAAQGMTPLQVSQSLGVSLPAVYQAAFKHGLRFVTGKVTPQNYHLMALFIRGASAPEAAALTGMSASAVYGWAKMRNLRFMNAVERRYAQIWDCIVAGMTVAQAVEALSISAHSLESFANKYRAVIVCGPVDFRPAVPSAVLKVNGRAVVSPAAVAVPVPVSAPVSSAAAVAAPPAPAAPVPVLVQRFARDIDASGCRALWANVLLVQWQDAFSEGDYPDANANRKKARLWFGGRGFRDVCALCGLDSDAVMDRFNRRVQA